MTVYVAENEANYYAHIKHFLVNYLGNLNKPRLVTIGVSGGSMPKFLCPVLNEMASDFKKKNYQICLFPVDERLVPNDDADNNMFAYVKETDGAYSERMIRIDENTIHDANLAASKFEESLKGLNPPLSDDGFPIFDILFLGLGPDGHTCSLFPGHKLLQEKSKWIAPIEDSPKSPKCRVTITLPVINNAHNVVFLVTGDSKATIIKGIIEDKNKAYTPALLTREETHWFLDRAAASALSQKSL